MARRLLGARYQVAVHNPSDAAIERLSSLGAPKAATPRYAAADADVVITMPPDGPGVEQHSWKAIGSRCVVSALA